MLIQHLAINIYMNMHTHRPICIYLSLSQPWAGNICLPELREWVGVKAMTASMFLDVNLHHGKTRFSLWKKHAKCTLFNTFLQTECLSSWGIAGTEAQMCGSATAWAPGALPWHSLPATQDFISADTLTVGPTHVPWLSQAYCFHSAAYNQS